MPPECFSSQWGASVLWWCRLSPWYKTLKHHLGPPEQFEHSQPRLGWRDCEEGKQNYTASILCSFVFFRGIFRGSTVLILDFSGKTFLDKETVARCSDGLRPIISGTLVIQVSTRRSPNDADSWGLRRLGGQGSGFGWTVFGFCVGLMFFGCRLQVGPIQRAVHWPQEGQE